MQVNHDTLMTIVVLTFAITSFGWICLFIFIAKFFNRKKSRLDNSDLDSRLKDLVRHGNASRKLNL